MNKVNTTPDLPDWPDWMKALQSSARRVRDMEEQAAAALARGDTETHSERLRDKCLTLIALPEEVLPLAEGEDALLRENLANKLGHIAARANRGLELGSPFFMSLLLYPDDYAPGQPNELELYIASLGQGAP